MNQKTDPKTNIHIFDKKEIFLVFVFMILASLLSFMLGVRVGVSYSFEQAGLTNEDRQTVDLLGPKEEEVKSILENRSNEGEDSSKQIKEQMHKKLKAKIDRELKQSSVSKAVPKAAPSPVQAVALAKDRRGKYTIQLGSYRTREEAEEFANGFRIKGHEPIITQVEIAGRGIWFRVSLGEFSGAVAAKAYVQNEEELFMGQDYVFVQF